MLVFQFVSGSSRDDACLLDGPFFLVHIVGGAKDICNKGKSFSFVSFSSSSMDRDDGRTTMPWSLPLEVAVVRVPLVATRGDFRSPLVPLKKISLEEKRNFKLIENKKVRSPYFHKKKI